MKTTGGEVFLSHLRCAAKEEQRERQKAKESEREREKERKRGSH